MRQRLALRTLRHPRLGLFSLWLVLMRTAAGGLLAAPAALAKHGVPTPAHIVVVIEENHSSNEIIGSSSAPYINALGRTPI